MTKREMIEEITRLNPTASPDFLAIFETADLAKYLARLRRVCPLAAPGGDADHLGNVAASA